MDKSDVGDQSLVDNYVKEKIDLFLLERLTFLTWGAHECAIFKFMNCGCTNQK